MPPTSTEHHQRARSLSTGTAPARAVDDAPEFDKAKRAAIPRAASTLGMYNTAREDKDAGDPFRDIAREQVDRETLRDLAHFFKHTRPPTTRYMDPASAENCFGKSGSGSGENHSKRWSIRSLRRGTKGKPRPSSLQLRDSTILKTTAAGHQYMAISVPFNGTGDGRPSFQSRLSALQQQHIAPVLGSPRRNSSADIQGTASPTSSRTQPSKHESADLAAVVSRSSSRFDKNPFQLSIRVSTAEPGVRSLLKLVDEWLEDQHSSDSPQAVQGQRLIGPSQPSTGAVPTVLSPVVSEIVEEELDDDGSAGTPTTAPTTAPTPTIMVKPALSSSPVRDLPGDAPYQTASLPMTPPAVESQGDSFPDLAPRPQSAGASMASPRSPESASRVALSTFPNTSPAKQSPVRSPKQGRKPANISVKRTLEVPQAQIQPDSPGFPKMLAAMTFPSPPESVKSHSASNSIASSDPNRSIATPPLTGRSSVTSSTPSTLDQRVMHPARPGLKHYKSDSAFNSSYVSQRSIASSLGTYDGNSAEISIAKMSKGRSEHRKKPSYTFNKPSRLNLVSAADDSSMRRASLDSVVRTEEGSQRQSTVSTIASSRQSMASDRHRHSIKSDTSAASDATAMDEAFSKARYSNRDSVSTFDERRRSETQCSTRSVSSSGTNGTAASLAERRMARRARVREKVQRDLDATKIKNVQVQKPPSFGVADAVDSPVLGWFPQLGQGAHPQANKKTPQVPSRLALQSVAPDTPSETTPTESKPLRHASRRSSVGDISQLIPETVEETTTPVTPKAPQPPFTFSPIMAEQTAPDGEAEPEEPSTPTVPELTLTSIMTVADIEAQSPDSTLRPLSLLTTGSSAPPIVPPRSTLRPDTQPSARQRRLPVRVSKNPLELTVNTKTKSKRNSSPHIPTPPVSPDPGSSRLSFFSIKPTSAPPSTNYHQSWTHPPQHSRQTQSLKDKETEWLTNHQRQTAEDWRLEALMRREQLERDMAQESAEQEEEEGEEAKDVKPTPADDGRRQPREQHRRSTLRILNSNAGPSSTSSGAISDTASSVTDDEKTPTTVVTDDNRRASQARSASEAEAEVEARLLKTLMPLLQNMQTTLNEMQRNSASKELSKKFMDSALALTGPLMGDAEQSDERKTQPPSEGLLSE